MRIWKRLLGTALCLCAAVCVMSVGASAEGEHTEHPICGANHENIGDHTGTCEAVTWTAWNGTDEITYDADTKTAYVYLASDATRNNRLIVKTGCTLYLCLNGNSLTSSVTSSSDKNSEVINVPNNAKFILCDCKDSGTITHSPDAKGKGVRVGTESNPAATFSMYGGTISGNHADAQCWGSGGAGVEIHNGTFKMYGGTISDNYEENTGSNYGGGGVCAHSSGTFTMYGGTISGNTAKNDGGGVYFNGNTLTISDTVKIEGNSAANGGGVYLNSQDLSVTGGSIINNNATGSGGGVYFKGDTFGDTFNVSGHVSITGNKKGATSTGSGLIGGTDNNVYLPDGKTITVAGALTGSSNKIGVTTENTPSASNYVQIASGNTNNTDPDKFLYENDGAIAVSAVVTGNTTKLVACQHNWSREWTTDAYQHWKECSICKGKNDVSAHTYDQKVAKESYKASDANCVSPALYHLSCVCGAKGADTFESGEKNPDKHRDALGDWQSDENNHWKEYPCCQVHADKAPHNWDTGVIKKQPTCTAAGEKTFTCTVCSATRTETVSATGHSWSDAWMHDATHHWHECKNGCTEKSSYAEHSGGTANCTQQAVCTICGTAYGDLDPNGHDWGEPSYVWNGTSCTAERVCSRDSSHKETETVTAAVMVTQHQSCLLDELSTYTASFQNAAFATQTQKNVVTANKLGHTNGAAVREKEVPATCTANGSYDEVVYCTVCNAEVSREAKSTDALGHDWGAWAVTTPATTSAEGVETRTCKRDKSHTETRAIPKLTPAPSGGGSSSGSGGAPTVTVPVSGSGETVHVSASVSGSTAEVKEIKSAELDKIGTDSTVVIDLSGLNKGVTGVTLSTDTIDSICKTEADGVTIKLPSAELRVDRQTLAAVTEQAAGSKIRLVVEPDGTARSTMTAAQKSTLAGMKNAAALEAYFVSDGTRIHDFKGGSVELSIPYRADGAIRAWFLKEDGTREPVSAHYDKENAQLILHHFSHYVIEELDSSAAYTVCAKDDSCPLGAFGDLTAAAWYHDGVHYCLENGLMRGVSGGKFLPDGITTRAQLVTILWRLEGGPETNGAVRFGDVAGGAWYTQAVRWAAGCGVVKGYDNGCFGPDDAVTREQMAAILYRYAQHKGYDVSAGKDTNILSFNDAFAVSEYAIPAMQWACGSGMVRGIAQKGGMLLAPMDTTTRAQTATLLMRFQSAFAKEP